MAQSPQTFDELLTFILMFGGADAGGGGIGVTDGGKVRKIPPRQDLGASLTDERRDELILEAMEILARGLGADQTRAAIERATTEAKQTTER